MGFTDLMGSSRGPGVIGTFVALIVIGGFGLLFFFVFDENMQGGKQSIESVIRRQNEELVSTRQLREQRRKELADGEEREVQAAEIGKLSLTRDSTARRLAETTTARDQAAGDLAAAEAAFAKYQDDYRSSERKAARGELLDELKLISGTVYTGVKILDIDDVGMQIRHSGGSIRVPYADLPLPLQDRFQFDEKQKEAAAGVETGIAGNHLLAVRISGLREQVRAKENQIETLQRELTASQNAKSTDAAAVTRHDDEMRELRAAIRREQKKSVSKAPQLEATLAKKEKEWAARPSIDRDREINDRRAKISGLKAEIAELGDEIAQTIEAGPSVLLPK